MIETTILTPDEMWPDHAGHDITYSEHGRTDYTVLALRKEIYEDGSVFVEVDEHSDKPIDGKINDTEVWCDQCGVPLSLDID